MWKRTEFAESIPVKTTEAKDHRFTHRPTIGAGTLLKGEIVAADDLCIEGRIEGRIECPDCCVTISATGTVFGDISARVINVEGVLHGDAVAAEKVRIARSGAVNGNITSPCMALEEGAKLRGMIDMGPEAAPLAITSIPSAVSELERAQQSITDLQLSQKLVNGRY